MPGQFAATSLPGAVCTRKPGIPRRSCSPCPAVRGQSGSAIVNVGLAVPRGGATHLVIWYGILCRRRISGRGQRRKALVALTACAQRVVGPAVFLVVLKDARSQRCGRLDRLSEATAGLQHYSWASRPGTRQQSTYHVEGGVTIFNIGDLPRVSSHPLAMQGGVRHFPYLVLVSLLRLCHGGRPTSGRLAGGHNAAGLVLDSENQAGYYILAKQALTSIFAFTSGLTTREKRPNI